MESIVRSHKKGFMHDIGVTIMTSSHMTIEGLIGGWVPMAHNQSSISKYKLIYWSEIEAKEWKRKICEDMARLDINLNWNAIRRECDEKNIIGRSVDK